MKRYGESLVQFTNLWECLTNIKPRLYKICPEPSGTQLSISRLCGLPYQEGITEEVPACNNLTGVLDQFTAAKPKKLLTESNLVLLKLIWMCAVIRTVKYFKVRTYARPEQTGASECVFQHRFIQKYILDKDRHFHRSNILCQTSCAKKPTEPWKYIDLGWPNENQGTGYND
ncbi:hypothetical protein Pelo_12981 [Pelomyxa schiedti]|nr:hypothetical protein Pelo_12981 [Pelomyxa schiedti]